MTKPTIVFDVDGVLIQWTSQLPFFCAKNGIDPAFVLKQYTNPTHITASELFGIHNHKIANDLLSRYNMEHGKYMTAFPDAVENVYKLAKDYNLIALTKFGNTTDHYMIRKFNLETFFPRCFSELITIDGSESKIPYLYEIMGREYVVAFVDDQLENIFEVDQKARKSVQTIHLNRYADSADARSVADIRGIIEDGHD